MRERGGGVDRINTLFVIDCSVVDLYIYIYIENCVVYVKDVRRDDSLGSRRNPLGVTYMRISE